MRLFDGAKETLQYLKQEAIPVIVLSNRDKKFVTEMLETFGINAFITTAIGSGDTMYSKPDVRILNFALESINITSCGKKILFVGDALADINCADASYVFPVLLKATKSDITDDWIRIARNENKEMWMHHRRGGVFKFDHHEQAR